MPSLESCLQKVASGLKHWGKGTLAKIRRDINKANAMLQELYSRPRPWDFHSINKAEEVLDKALE